MISRKRYGSWKQYREEHTAFFRLRDVTGRFWGCCQLRICQVSTWLVVVVLGRVWAPQESTLCNSVKLGASYFSMKERGRISFSPPPVV